MLIATNEEDLLIFCFRMLAFQIEVQLIIPVICANSTISAPNTENAFTNSVNVATDSSLPNVLDICWKIFY